MNTKIKEDLTEMKNKLKEYVDIGRTIDYHNLKEEPMIAGKPDSSKIKPLRKTDSCGVTEPTSQITRLILNTVTPR